MKFDLNTSPDQVVLFMDILGFSNFIAKNEFIKYNNPPVNEIIANMSEICALTEGYIKGANKDQKAKFLWMSDSILISAEKENVAVIIEMLDTAIYYFLCGDFFLRGGITIGPLHHEDNAWGSALCEGARLEEKVALYPRIIISEEHYKTLALDKLENYEFKQDMIEGKCYYYYDYFGTCLKNYQKSSVDGLLAMYADAVVKNFTEAKNEKHKECWQWVGHEIVAALQSNHTALDSKLATNTRHNSILETPITSVKMVEDYLVSKLGLKL